MGLEGMLNATCSAAYSELINNIDYRSKCNEEENYVYLSQNGDEVTILCETQPLGSESSYTFMGCTPSNACLNFGNFCEDGSTNVVTKLSNHEIAQVKAALSNKESLETNSTSTKQSKEGTSATGSKSYNSFLEMTKAMLHPKMENSEIKGMEIKLAKMGIEIPKNKWLSIGLLTLAIGLDIFYVWKGIRIERQFSESIKASSNMTASKGFAPIINAGRASASLEVGLKQLKLIGAGVLTTAKGTIGAYLTWPEDIANNEVVAE